MRAHGDLGKPEASFTYEVLKRAADANQMSVNQALETIAKTAAQDRGEHADDYGTVAQPATAQGGASPP